MEYRVSGATAALRTSKGHFSKTAKYEFSEGKGMRAAVIIVSGNC